MKKDLLTSCSSCSSCRICNSSKRGTSAKWGWGILMAVIFLLTAIAGYAQSPQYSIFDALEQQPKQGEGTVIIHQSNAIKRLVGTRIDSENIDVINGKSFLNTPGYRIHVYNGYIQRTSKTDVENLAKTLKERYPDLDTYTDFDAPVWKLRVGNFLTFEEASIMLRELRKAFPQQRNEIYIIEVNIRLPLD